MWKRAQRGFVALLVAGALSVVATSMAHAKVLRVIVEHRSDVLGGRSFGDAGPYEKLVGRVLFVFDPANPYNARIVDLENAPRNADGMVEAWANFVVLRPKNQPAGGRTALLEVSNRGGKLALTLMNAGSMSLDPTTAEDYGDGLAFRLGLTVMWVGWQHDMAERDDVLRIHIPTATANGRTITGLARSDWTVDRTASTLGLGHGGHRAYPVANFAHRDNVLTVRDGRMAQRRVVPRDSWRFAVEASGRTVEDSTSITLDDGFQAGKIYELVYRARDPQVSGSPPFATSWPMPSTIRRAHSQSITAWRWAYRKRDGCCDSLCIKASIPTKRADRPTMACLFSWRARAAEVSTIALPSRRVTLSAIPTTWRSTPRHS